jgi:hypothetical protein
MVDVLVTNKPNAVSPEGRRLVIEGVTFGPASGPMPDFNGPLQIPLGKYKLALLAYHVWFDVRALRAMPENAWWPNIFAARETFGPSDIITLDGENVSYPEFAWDYPLGEWPIIPRRVAVKADGTIRNAWDFWQDFGWAPFGRIPVREYTRKANVWGIFHDAPVVVVTSPKVPV